jgi:hypothetical protein
LSSLGLVWLSIPADYGQTHKNCLLGKIPNLNIWVFATRKVEIYPGKKKNVGLHPQAMGTFWFWKGLVWA